MEGRGGASMFRTSADAYDRHVGRYTEELAATFLEAVGIEAGTRALDIGCGPGAVTRALASRVGAENVAAVEPSHSFAEACRARVPGADVRNGSAEELPFDDDSFDAVVSQLVLNFMTDAEAGVGEMRRVARPGAVVAAAVWDYAEGMTLLRRFWDAARRVDPEGGAAGDEGAKMPYCTPPELEALWTTAGLTEIRTGELHVGADYDDFADLWHAMESGIGPSGAYLVSLDDDHRSALRLTLHELLGSPHGAFGLEARAWYVVGRA